MPYYETQPIIYPLHRLLDEVLTGEIRVPRFQRPGTEISWTPDQRGDLLDSIYRNFPIGTILLWSTTEAVGTLEVVGGALIPPLEDEKARRRIVLDGHQRLSTLVSILGPAVREYKRSEETREERWTLDISDDSSARTDRDRFVCYRPDERLPRKTLPLEIAYDRVSLNKWQRERRELSEDEVRRADSLRDRFREYSVPVATLAADSLDEATESFKRINSSGTPMSDFHMVTALAYSNEFDPQRAFQEARDQHLAELGWELLADADLLRVCAGLVRHRFNEQSQHPSKIQIEALARSMKNHQNVIEDAVRSVAATARLLERVGVHGPDILPYSWQLIVLAIELGSRREPRLEREEQDSAIRWFWLTTYGGVFAGVNSSVVDRASAALRKMMSGEDPSDMARDINTGVGEPQRFDFRAVRSKACLLSIARYLDEDRPDGRAHRALSHGISAVHAIYSKKGRSKWYNLMIGTPRELQEFRRAIWDRERSRSVQEQDLLLRRHGIPEDATGSIDDLLEARRVLLWNLEKRFIRDIGMDIHETPDRSGAEP